jgi:hypothetical protein
MGWDPWGGFWGEGGFAKGVAGGTILRRQVPSAVNTLKPIEESWNPQEGVGVCYRDSPSLQTQRRPQPKARIWGEGGGETCCVCALLYMRALSGQP